VYIESCGSSESSPDACLVLLAIPVESLLHVTGQVGRATLFEVYVLHNSTFRNSFGRRNRSSSNNDEAKREVVGRRKNRPLISDFSSAKPEPLVLWPRDESYEDAFVVLVGSASILGDCSTILSGHR
jgi:hypothetical protein